MAKKPFIVSFQRPLSGKQMNLICHEMEAYCSHETWVLENLIIFIHIARSLITFPQMHLISTLDCPMLVHMCAKYIHITVNVINDVTVVGSYLVRKILGYLKYNDYSCAPRVNAYKHWSVRVFHFICPKHWLELSLVYRVLLSLYKRIPQGVDSLTRLLHRLLSSLLTAQLNHAQNGTAALEQ